MIIVDPAPSLESRSSHFTQTFFSHLLSSSGRWNAHPLLYRLHTASLSVAANYNIFPTLLLTNPRSREHATPSPSLATDTTTHQLQHPPPRLRSSEQSCTLTPDWSPPTPLPRLPPANIVTPIIIIIIATTANNHSNNSPSGLEILGLHGVAFKHHWHSIDCSGWCVSVQSP